MYKERDDIYKHVAEGVETRLDTSNYELDRPLLKRKNKKLIKIQVKWILKQFKMSVKAFCSNLSLLWKTFTDVLNCYDVHFTYILFHMANLLNQKSNWFSEKWIGLKNNEKIW